jgi:hypothetical protein
VPDPARTALYRDLRCTFNKTYHALESHLYRSGGPVPAGQ